MVAVGEQLGQYELIEKLGSGGMASLYLARKTGAHGFERHAAVKVVHEHLANQDTLAMMFVDEARCSSRIDHPNVVRIDDFGEADGTTYLAMEYVHGCTLAELLQKLADVGRRLDPAMAVSIAMQVASGLHAAHTTKTAEGEALEIVHRDVSPQNILLSYNGQVKLIDFGIAKARFRIVETKSVRIKGKLRYMAPEQLLMAGVDARTDVYALGIVLWEMLSMRRYFDAPNDLAMIDLLRAPTARPLDEDTEVDAELEAALLRALAPDIDERPATARKFRKALRTACRDALDLEPEDLAEVLAEIMSEELEAATSSLPESIAKLTTRPIEDRGERARPLTRPAIALPEATSWRDDSVETNVEIVAPAERRPAKAPTPLAHLVERWNALPPPRLAIGIVVAVTAALFGATLAFVFTGDDPEVVALPAAGSSLPIIDTIVPETKPDPQIDRASQVVDLVVDAPDGVSEPEGGAELDEPVAAGLPQSATRARRTKRGARQRPRPSTPETFAIEGHARSCMMAGDNACIIRLLENERARTPSALRMLIEAYRARGQRDHARQHMQTFILRYPDHPSYSAYRQILARH